MSSSLVWYLKPNTNSFTSHSLKYILEKNYDLWSGGCEFNFTDLPYLKGLADSGVKDAQVLINLIEKYESVWLKLEI